jgi:hypothetical protein
MTDKNSSLIIPALLQILQPILNVNLMSGLLRVKKKTEHTQPRSYDENKSSDRYSTVLNKVESDNCSET